MLKYEDLRSAPSKKQKTKKEIFKLRSFAHEVKIAISRLYNKQYLRSLCYAKRSCIISAGAHWQFLRLFPALVIIRHIFDFM